MDWHQWFKTFFIRRLEAVVLIQKHDSLRTKNWPISYIGQPLKILIQKIYSSFRDIIWGDDLAEMRLLNKYNKVITFLLSIIDI